MIQAFPDIFQLTSRITFDRSEIKLIPECICKYLHFIFILLFFEFIYITFCDTGNNRRIYLKFFTQNIIFEPKFIYVFKYFGGYRNVSQFAFLLDYILVYYNYKAIVHLVTTVLLI